MRIPRLILINGPPGIGKSTLASLYVQDHPLALNLDIDKIRMSLGQWETHPESKQLARNHAKEAARVHLRTGHDVVIPQLLARPDFIDELQGVALETGAEFVEIYLRDEGSSLDRFLRRRETLQAAGAPHPEMAIDDGAEADVLAEINSRLEEIVEHRPGAVVVQTGEGQVDAAYQKLLTRVNST